MNVIDTRGVLIAHAIINSILPAIRYPEEWNYLLCTQIQPRLQQDLRALRASNQDIRDWSLLYYNFVTTMFTAVEKALNVS